MAEKNTIFIRLLPWGGIDLLSYEIFIDETVRVVANFDGRKIGERTLSDLEDRKLINCLEKLRLPLKKNGGRSCNSHVGCDPDGSKSIEIAGQNFSFRAKWFASDRQRNSRQFRDLENFALFIQNLIDFDPFEHGFKIL